MNVWRATTFEAQDNPNDCLSAFRELLYPLDGMLVLCRLLCYVASKIHRYHLPPKKVKIIVSDKRFDFNGKQKEKYFLVGLRTCNYSFVLSSRNENFVTYMYSPDLNVPHLYASGITVSIILLTIDYCLIYCCKIVISTCINWFSRLLCKVTVGKLSFSIVFYLISVGLSENIINDKVTNKEQAVSSEIFIQTST